MKPVQSIQFGYGEKLYFGGVRRQKGSGLGGIFGTIARYLTPLIKKAGNLILPYAFEAAITSWGML